MTLYVDKVHQVATPVGRV